MTEPKKKIPLPRIALWVIIGIVGAYWLITGLIGILTN
ncbi:MAG: hypothetical protein JWP30_1933 [Homoserinimonas sp.]|jgi:hypothetical protein|nr:hypothetical protein [Homoserinimonas sp.]